MSSRLPHRRDSTIPNIISEVKLGFASSGDNTIVAAVAGQVIRVYKIFFVVASAVSVKFKDGAGTDLTAAMSLTGSGSFVLDFDPYPWVSTTSGNAFVINLSGAVQASGRLWYTQS